MNIPIDRPLIDGRNTRDAATQTASAGFVATHNQRSVLLLTTGAANYVSGAPHIQAGAQAGQELLIIVTDDANKITITDGNGAGTQLNGNWVVADTFGIGAKIWLVWDGTRWWEVDRKNGELTASGIVAHAQNRQTTASGAYSHAEGAACAATNTSAHAEGQSTDATGSISHAEGNATLASGQRSHAQGEHSVAALYGEHAQAGGRFAAVGDAQFIRVVVRRGVTHSDANWYTLFLDGVDELIIILADSTYTFQGLIVGKVDNDSKRFGFKFEGVIARDGANNTTLLTSVVTTLYDADDVSFDVQVVADDANEALLIQVQDTGAASDVVHWVAYVDMVRVVF